MKPIRLLTIAIVLVSLTACGSDDPDTSAPSGDSTPDVVAFCDAAADLDAGTLEGEDSTDASDEVQSAGKRLDQYVADHCDN